MSIIPVAIQIIPLLPGLIDSVLKIVNAVKADPATPTEARNDLEEVSARLTIVLEKVKNARLPAPRPPSVPG